jgi:hypothetical protein
MRYIGKLSVNIRYYLPLLLLFTVSCSGGESTGRPTVDATQRWLSAKCPPQEACAPEAGLEDAAQEYLEALILGNCDQAADYWLPERKDRAREHCVSGRLLPELRDEGCKLIEFSSRETKVEQLGEGISVHMTGEYLFECDQVTEGYEVEDLILFFEEREGEWYIAGFNS